ncbi:YbhB/YbcL family Raf kinase inhibitor-like protein [Pseudoalteromonas phenolica]|uniref:YbhB/YbcL family Raf kinase inhibitor-like protein n=1 Tax=Pseudoalteromonas phenolica TaxID=161398 RepID=A0A5R9Q0R5_9GAMM|nr:YbhB/YbcL family Raf kinase inhibitor-like protein [Pseudoalteromonas phenolica]TLX46743.1 YbhB/YbcL family Raf kinase inhibitor-like protein [Pseudoalteromonas phenolica]
MHQRFVSLPLSLSATLLISMTAFAKTNTFELSSNDIKAGEVLSSKHVYKGFGCDGGNLSPHLAWSGAPKDTKAYAVFAYDPDAPTGSGWWHWQLVNLPANTTELKTGVGILDNTLLPQGAIQINNDFGSNDFGGACPPKGHGPHRYQFTVFALAKPLNVSGDTKSAVVGYMVNANMLAKASIEVTYQRD